MKIKRKVERSTLTAEDLELIRKWKKRFKVFADECFALLSGTLIKLPPTHTVKEIARFDRKVGGSIWVTVLVSEEVPK